MELSSGINHDGFDEEIQKLQPKAVELTLNSSSARVGNGFQKCSDVQKRDFLTHI